MDENHQVNEQHSSRWVTAVTCSALVLLVTTGGVLALRDQLLVDATKQAQQQTAEREKLAARIDAVQSALDALGTAPKADDETLAGITTELAETTNKLDALAKRIDAIEKQLAEKKPDPVAEVVTPAPVTAAAVAAAAPTPPAAGAELTALRLAALSGKPFTNELTAWVKLHPQHEKDLAQLTEVAATGIISEAEMARGLLDALEAKPATTKIDDASTVGKLNTHLKGLVSIKKTTSSDPYAQLRKDALRDDAEMLTRSVERLSEADRAPLAAWLTKAQQRRSALETLGKLTPDAGH